MKKNVFLTFFFCLLFPALAACGEKYTLVSELYPPYEYFEDGKNKGMDVEILEAAAAKVGIKISIQFYSWKRALDMVKKGEADGIFSIIKKKEREEFLSYLPEPLYIGKNVLVAKNNYKNEIKSLHDLKGKTLGIVNGNYYGDEFDQLEGIQKDGVVNQGILFKKFQAGRIPLILTTEEVAIFYLEKMQIKDAQILPVVITSVPYYLALSKKTPTFEKFYAQITKGISLIENSGEAKKIRKKYLNHVLSKGPNLHVP